MWVQGEINLHKPRKLNFVKLWILQLYKFMIICIDITIEKLSEERF
jgi:hypothetical protein